MNNFSARCILFTPANRPERFEKAKLTGADGIVIDLEDAITLAEKDSAREIAINYFKDNTSIPKDPFLRCLRINSVKTRAGFKDLVMLCETGVRPDIIILPKTESAEEINILNQQLAPNLISIIALIETSKGLSHSEHIAKAQNVCGIVFGGADLAADLGATMDWEPMYASRAQIVRAASIAGIAAIDVPYLGLHDLDDSALVNETKRVKSMGFTSKFAIHPKHIKPILDVFTPSAEEVEKAKKLVSVFSNAHGNACEVDGKMVDIPVFRSAQRILKLAKISI
jgi:hypothetical protein